VQLARKLLTLLQGGLPTRLLIQPRVFDRHGRLLREQHRQLGIAIGKAGTVQLVV
jgi:hypothetical protein